MNNGDDDLLFGEIRHARSRGKVVVVGTPTIMTSAMLRAYENAIQARVYYEPLMSTISGFNPEFIIYDDDIPINYAIKNGLAQFEIPKLETVKPKDWYRKFEGKKYGKKNFR